LRPLLLPAVVRLLLSAGAQNRPVMGAPKPAILRNWRFVHYRWLSALAGGEWCDGESTQDGGSSSNSGTFARRLVQPAHCPTSRRSPGDGRTPSSPVAPRQFKTGQRAHRLGSLILGSGGAPIGSARAPAGLVSAASAWREVNVQKLEMGLTAQRIYQDLCSDHGYTGSYYSVRRLVKKLTATMPAPFRRMECEPGTEAQVDFGRGAPIVGPDGRRKTTWVFRIVLSHSRKGYAEAVHRQTTDDFLRCLENAFAHFGGIPRTLVIDNLRAAVSRADWFDPELCPKVRSFAGHYGIAILPTKPYTPRHKGKIERGIGYVKSNALKGR